MIGDLVRPFTDVKIFLYPTCEVLVSDEDSKIGFDKHSIGVIVNIMKFNSMARCRVLTPEGIGWTSVMLLVEL